MPTCSTRAHRRRATPAALFAIAGLLTVATLASGCGPDEPARAAAPAPSPTPAATPATPPTAVSSAAPATATGVPGQVPAEMAALLAAIKAADKDQLAVSEEDGQFLRLLVASTGRKRALEIGAASGYSAIWIGMGLRDTGGRLVTIEFDPARAKEAAENVRKAGLDDIVQVVAGDAFQEIPKIGGTFDCIFVDAWKRDYIKFFELTWPRLDKGGLFLGHNVINKKNEMPDFLDRIARHPDLFSSIVAPSGEGISVSYKRR